MPRFCIVLLLIIIFPTVVLSQQDEQYSHYMFNNMAFNPGYAGSKDEISATLLQRNQWIGMPGAPKTSVVNIHTPFKLFNMSHGVGINIENGQIGGDKNFGVNVAYAYRMNVNNGAGKLGIGFSGGLRNKALNVAWIYPGPDKDESIPEETGSSGMTYDIGLGLYYKSENIYIGASTTHLTQSSVDYGKGNFGFSRHYYLTAGYSFTLPNPAFEILPSVLISSDAISSKLDLNTLVQYNKKVWGGVTFRPGVSITGMAGIELLNGIRIGYAYDHTFGDFQKYSVASSHEIIVTYGFSIIKEKIPHKYRSIRFL